MIIVSRHIHDDTQEDVGTTTITSSTSSESTTEMTTTSPTTTESTLRPGSTTSRSRTTTPDYYDYDEDYYYEVDTDKKPVTTEKTGVTINYQGDYESVDDHKRKFNTSNSDKDEEPLRIPDICQGHFDAVSILRNELFFFKDQVGPALLCPADTSEAFFNILLFTVRLAITWAVGYRLRLSNTLPSPLPGASIFLDKNWRSLRTSKWKRCVLLR